MDVLPRPLLLEVETAGAGDGAAAAAAGLGDTTLPSLGGLAVTALFPEA